MRIFGLVLVAAFASGANAAPLPTPTSNGEMAAVQFVHHKEWHQGGPPWTRQSPRGRGNAYGWERRRGWDDRGWRWRGESRYESWIERPSRSYRSYRYDD